MLLLGDEVSMLVGNLSGILSSGAICVVVSLVSARNRVVNDAEVWENTRDIDSPLSPWTELYARYMTTSHVISTVRSRRVRSHKPIMMTSTPTFNM